MKRSLALYKQTLNPPKRVLPIAQNPLARWSHYLGFWSTKGSDTLFNVTVGLEGCNSAFNATAAIRTTRFFKTGTPPVFLSLSQWEEIEHIQSRKDEEHCIALFGEKTFLENNASRPLVALENFTNRSESIFTTRLPDGMRLVVGHENCGVRNEFLYGTSTVVGKQDEPDRLEFPSMRAEKVVYVPQYGTISSLNVVTSLGIALFYAYMDQNYATSRILVNKAERANTVDNGALHQRLVEYQQFFESALPTPTNVERAPKSETESRHVNTTPRCDPRPIHPLFYQKNATTIQSDLAEFRRVLLQLSGTSRPNFGLSLFYENDYDQRNFGGLIRNANAFLVDKVFYVGRKKFNVVGAVGSYHYNPPVYCGPVHKGVFAAGGPHLTRNTDVEFDYRGKNEEEWFTEVNCVVENECLGPVQYWMLDLGHHRLYQTDPSAEEAALPEDPHALSSPESLEWYEHMHRLSENIVHCTDTEDHLRSFLSASVHTVLVVPQEGKLPEIALLRHCSKLLRILPPDPKEQMRWCGLSSQVASGIALQRLSSVMHPNIKYV